jgi:hypothetical protein
MKVLIFIEVDIVVRHFVHSGAFTKLESLHDITYVFPDGHKRLGQVDPAKLDLAGSRRLTLEVCQRRLLLWRKRFFVEMLRGQRGTPASQTAALRKLFRYGNPLKVYILYRTLGLPGIFQLFTVILNRLLARTPNKKLEELLEREEPDVIIHPCVLQGSYINDLVEAGSRGNIPTVVIMNSWDNPATKRSVVGVDYWLLVWGPQTRNHAERFMGMAPQKILEFGAAQFDIYGEPPKRSRQDFLRAHALPLNKPTLLYAGSSKETNEFEHLRLIDEAITSGLLPDMNVIYRPHPWGEGGKGGARFLDYHFDHVAIDREMRCYLERIRQGDTNKFLSNYSDTRDLLLAVDAVISPLSTILIEAMMLGKAPMCFMPIEEVGAKHLQLVRTQVHFTELLSLPEMVVIWGVQDLLNGVTEVMRRANDPCYPAKLRKASEFFIRPHVAPFRERIVDFIEGLRTFH